MTDAPNEISVERIEAAYQSIKASGWPVSRLRVEAALAAADKAEAERREANPEA